MKGKKFLALLMVGVMLSFVGSAEAFKIPKISKGTKKGVGKLLNKIVDKGSDVATEKEKTKQKQAEARKKPNTTVINNTTNNTVNNNVNVNNNTNINQTQINQTQNIGTNGGGAGSAGMSVGGGAAGMGSTRTRPRSQAPAPQSSSDPANELKVSMRNFGSRMIANNAPAYEIQLSQKELPARVKTRFNRVFAQDQTIIVGDAGSNKRYGAFCLVTSDPSYTFAGGIRVGASVSTVENFFGKTISQLSTQPGHAHIVDNSVEIDILYRNNKITQIGYYDSNSLSCQRTGNFVSRKTSELGLYQMY